MGEHWVRNQPLSRFWQRVQKSDGCWEWTGPLKRGYGSFYYDSHQGTAHRFIWELTHGPIPEGKLVCHTCDNRKCVREDHLFLGTCRDNIRDAIAKGRFTQIHKTHCKRGHAFDKDNTLYVDKGNNITSRLCRACLQMREHNRPPRRKAA